MTIFKIFDSAGNVIGTVNKGERVFDLLDLDENILYFRGKIIAGYSTEDRTAEIFDEICNAFHQSYSGFGDYTLPKK